MHIGKQIEALVKAHNKDDFNVFLAQLCYTREYVFRLYKQEHVNTEVLRNFSDVLGIPLNSFFQPNENDTELNLNSKKNYNQVQESQNVVIANEGHICLSERQLYERLIHTLEQQLAEKNKEIEFLRSLLNQSNS